MIVSLIRFHHWIDDTLGLWFIDGQFAAFSIEDEERSIEAKLPGETRIPEGEYELVLENSPKFSPKYGHPMITVKGVKGFSEVRFHILNTEKDTDGCVGPGNTMHFNPTGNSRMSESKLAYDRMYPIVSAAIKKGKVRFIVKKLPLAVILNEFKVPEGVIG